MYCSRKKRLGRNDLRDRLLAAQGFRVMPLPYFVWDRMPKVRDNIDTLSPQGLRELEAMLLAAARTGTVLWQQPGTRELLGHSDSPDEEL